MAGIGGILGNNVLQQLLIYNVLGQLLSGPLTPFVVAATNAANQLDPVVPLTPADLALAVIRNELSEADAGVEASKSGVHQDRFHTLVRITGDAPAPEAMAVALRRGFVDDATYLTGIRQGRLRDEWADLVKRLATEDPPPSTALLADLKGQLPTAEAQGLYQAFGGNPDHYTLAFDVEGQGPSPLEAAEAARRGIIAWGGIGAQTISFEQAVRESAYRNKWLPVFRALAEYLPPPRTTTALYREGAINAAKAGELFAKAGLPPDLVTAYLASASRTKTAHAHQLTEATVSKLYADRIISRTQAAAFLVALAYAPAEAELILESLDLVAVERALSAAVNRVHALYAGHKIDATAAAAALASLGVEASQAGELLTVWGHERAANVRVLTEAQVVAAFGIGVLDQATAQADLEAQGYSPHDAWTLLSIHHKAALPDEPAAGALPAPAGP